MHLSDKALITLWPVKVSTEWLIGRIKERFCQ
jgi:hypothetical protein